MRAVFYCATENFVFLVTVSVPCFFVFFFFVSLNEDISCISVWDCNLVCVRCTQLKVLWSGTRSCIGISVSDVICKYTFSAVKFSFFNLIFLGFYSTFLKCSSLLCILFFMVPLILSNLFFGCSLIFFFFFFLRLTFPFCKSSLSVYFAITSAWIQIYHYQPVVLWGTDKCFHILHPGHSNSVCGVFPSNLYIFTHFICVSLWRMLASTTDACNFSIVWPQCQHVTEM